MLSRLQNDVLGNVMGLEALVGARTRATDALLKRKHKKRLIYGNLYYHAVYVMRWPGKTNLPGFSSMRQAPLNFFNGGGPDCRIISVRSHDFQIFWREGM